MMAASADMAQTRMSMCASKVHMELQSLQLASTSWPAESDSDTLK